MHKTELAEELRQCQRELAHVDLNIIDSLGDDEIIDSYITCSCCGEKQVTSDELGDAITEASNVASFFRVVDRLSHHHALMSYQEACEAYFSWAEKIPGQPENPSEGQSEFYDGLWHLENVSGPLVVVTDDSNVIPVGHFFAAYDRLADDGKCDCAGGMEYRRVLREWIDAGQPDDLDEFIVRRANVGPCE